MNFIPISSMTGDVDEQFPDIGKKPNHPDYGSILASAAERYGVSDKLPILQKMLNVESGGDPNAVSRKGAKGLMQLMPGTARSLGVKNIDDPEENINAGVKYFADQFNAFGDDALALAAYNAGPGAVRKHKGIPPYRETQNYVNKILGDRTVQKAGTPYNFGMKNSDKGGVDCSGWVCEQLKAAGVDVQDTAAGLAQRAADVNMLSDDATNIQPGSLLFVSNPGDPGHAKNRFLNIKHTGIVTERNGKLFVSEVKTRGCVSLTPLEGFMRRNGAKVYNAPISAYQNPDAAGGMFAGPGAASGDSFVPLDKLDAMDKFVPSDGFVALDSLEPDKPQTWQDAIPSIGADVLGQEPVLPDRGESGPNQLREGVRWIAENIGGPLAKAAAISGTIGLPSEVGVLPRPQTPITLTDQDLSEVGRGGAAGVKGMVSGATAGLVQPMERFVLGGRIGNEFAQNLDDLKVSRSIDSAINKLSQYDPKNKLASTAGGPVRTDVYPTNETEQVATMAGEFLGAALPISRSVSAGKFLTSKLAPEVVGTGLGRILQTGIGGGIYGGARGLGTAWGTGQDINQPGVQSAIIENAINDAAMFMGFQLGLEGIAKLGSLSTYWPQLQDALKKAYYRLNPSAKPVVWEDIESFFKDNPDVLSRAMQDVPLVKDVLSQATRDIHRKVVMDLTKGVDPNAVEAYLKSLTPEDIMRSMFALDKRFLFQRMKENPALNRLVSDALNETGMTPEQIKARRAARDRAEYKAEQQATQEGRKAQPEEAGPAADEPAQAQGKPKMLPKPEKATPSPEAKPTVTDEVVSEVEDVYRRVGGMGEPTSKPTAPPAGGGPRSAVPTRGVGRGEVPVEKLADVELTKGEGVAKSPWENSKHLGKIGNYDVYFAAGDYNTDRMLWVVKDGNAIGMPRDPFHHGIPATKKAQSKQATKVAKDIIEKYESRQQSLKENIGGKEPFQATTEEWLNGTRFYRSGNTKNAVLPNGEKVILTDKATATNFRTQSRGFLLRIHKNIVEGAINRGQLTPTQAKSLGHFDAYPELRERFEEKPEPTLADGGTKPRASGLTALADFTKNFLGDKSPKPPFDDLLHAVQKIYSQETFPGVGRDDVWDAYKAHVPGKQAKPAVSEPQTQAEPQTPAPEPNKEELRKKFLEEVDARIAKKKALVDENLRLAGENPSLVVLKSESEPDKQIVVFPALDPNHKGDWQISYLDTLMKGKVDRTGMPAATDAEGWSPSGHEFAPTLKKAMEELATYNREFVVVESRPPAKPTALDKIKKRAADVRAQEGTKTANKLRTLADGLEKQIEAKFNPASAHQTPTRRRAAMVESAYREGERLKKIQLVLRKLADLHEAGSISPELSKITSRSSVEELLTTDFYEPGVHAAHLKDVYKETATRAQGISQERNYISRILPVGENYWVSFANVNLESIAKVAAKGSTYAFDQVKKALTRANRLKSAGIDTKAKWQKAKELLDDVLSAKQEVPKEAELKRLEKEFIGRKIPGFFVTPSETASKMVSMADIKPGMKVLEPSAGIGNIADEIRKAHPDADLAVIEWGSAQREVLEKKGYSLAGQDFLEHHGEYDRIIMNPPFENGQDIDHIRHAYSLLKPGGKIVAIMSEGPFFRGDKKATQFREWMDDIDGTSEKLPEKTFAKTVTTTGVNARLVTIEKPSELKTPAPDAEFRKKFGTAKRDDVKAVIGKTPETEKKQKVKPKKSKTKPIGQQQTEAAQAGDSAKLVRLSTKIDPKSHIIKTNVHKDEFRYLLGYLDSKTGVAPDDLLKTLQAEYGYDLFPYDTDAEFVRAIIDRTLPKPFDPDEAAKKYYEEMADAEQLAKEEGLDDQGFAEVKEDVERVILSEEDLAGGVSESKSGLTAEEIDSFWDDAEAEYNALKNKNPFSGMTIEERLGTVKRTLKNLSDTQAEALADDYEAYSRAVQAQHAEYERKRILKNQGEEFKERPILDKMGDKKGGLFESPRADYSAEPAPAFYSKLQQMVEDDKFPKQAPGTVMAGILNSWAGKGQIKADELKQSGVIPWLQEQKGKVSKGDVVEYLRGNRVDVRVIRKGIADVKDKDEIISIVKKYDKAWPLFQPTTKYDSTEAIAAYGSTKKAREARSEVAREVRERGVSRPGVQDISRRNWNSEVAKIYQRQGFINLQGHQLRKGNEAQDLADLFVIYRSPKVETLREIYTDAAGNVLAHNASTSGELSYVHPQDLARYLYHVKRRAQKLGADKVHILHNHPAGDPSMSKADVGMAKQLKKDMGGLMGEFVVINHEKFTYIKGQGNPATGTYTETPGDAGSWLVNRETIGKSSDIMRIAKGVQAKEGQVIALHLNARGQVNGVTAHNPSIFGHPEVGKNLAALSKSFDADRVAIVADSRIAPVLFAKLADSHTQMGDWLLDFLDDTGGSYRFANPGLFTAPDTKYVNAWQVYQNQAPYTATSPPKSKKQLGMEHFGHFVKAARQDLSDFLGIPQHLAKRLGWNSLAADQRKSLITDRASREQYLVKNYPLLSQADISAIAGHIPTFKTYVQHPAYREYNELTELRLRTLETLRNRWLGMLRPFLEVKGEIREKVWGYTLAADRIGSSRMKKETKEQKLAKLEADLLRLHGEEAHAAFRAWRDTSDNIWQTFNDMFRAMGVPANEISALRREMGMIPGYFPHTRPGKHHIIARVTTAAGKTHTVWRSSVNFWWQIQPELDRVTELVNKKYGQTGRKIEVFDETEKFSGELPEEAYWQVSDANAAQIAKAAIERLSGRDMSDEEIAKMNEEVANVLKTRGFARHFIKRKNTPGWKQDELDQVALNFVGGAAGMASKMTVAPLYHVMLAKVKAKTEPKVHAGLTNHVRDALQNQTRLDSLLGKLRGAAFSYYLAWVPRAWIVNKTGDYTSFAPYMGQFTKNAGSKIVAAELVAAKNFTEFLRLGKNERPNYSGISADEAWGIKRAFGSGLLSDIMTQELFGNQIGGNLPYVGKAIAKYQKYGRFMFGNIEIHNRLTSFLMAFRVWHNEHGLSKEEATKRALDAIETTHGNYSRYNMPNMVKGGLLGKLIRNTVYGFKFYPHNQFAMLRYMFQHDKKSFARAMRNLFIFGGPKAIPGMAAIAALYKWATGGDEPDKDFVDAQRHMPRLAYDVLRYGGPGLVGIDLSGSVDLDVLRLNGNSVWQTLGGPSVSMAVDVNEMYHHFKNGANYKAIEKISPWVGGQQLRNMMMAGRMYYEGASTRNASPVRDIDTGEPKTFTLGQALVRGGLGLQTTSLTNEREAKQRVRDLQAQADEKATTLANRYVNTSSWEKQEKILAEWDQYVMGLEKHGIEPPDLGRRIKNRERGVPEVPRKYESYYKSYE